MYQLLFSTLLVLSTASMALAQTTGNPLNDFVSAAGSAAGVITSINAQQTTPSSSSATPTSSSSSTAAASPTASSAPTSSGISKRNEIIIIVCVVVGVVLLAAILGGLLCCCLRRRRRNRAVTPIQDEEIKHWRSNEKPSSPGRNYEPVYQQGQVPSMQQQPTVPDMALMSGAHTEPYKSARPENPFVPVPPSPRRSAPNSRVGLTDGMVPGAEPFLGAAAGAGVGAAAARHGRDRSNESEKRPLRSSMSHSRTSSRSGLNDTYDGQPPLPIYSKTDLSSHPNTTLPSHPTTHNPPSPYAPVPSAENPHSPYSLSGIGRPYEDMHVHVLQGEEPSHELRNSLQNRDPIHNPDYLAERNTHARNSLPAPKRPLIPGRSPNRSPHRSPFTDYAYNSHSSADTTDSRSSPEWHDAPIVPSTTTTITGGAGGPKPWTRRQYNSSQGSSPTMPPSIPWESSSSSGSSGRVPTVATTQPWTDRERRKSRSPRQSMNVARDKSQPGTAKRLRFSDVQTEREYHDDYSGRTGHPRGVGEAM